MKTRPVLVTTQHRGVFAGMVPVDQDMNARTMRLEDAMMAIYWSGKRGVAGLADKGPEDGSRIGARVPVLEAVHDITAVWAMTDEAWERWTSYTN